MAQIRRFLAAIEQDRASQMQAQATLLRVAFNGDARQFRKMLDALDGES